MGDACAMGACRRVAVAGGAHVHSRVACRPPNLHPPMALPIRSSSIWLRSDAPLHRHEEPDLGQPATFASFEYKKLLRHVG